MQRCEPLLQNSFYTCGKKFRTSTLIVFRNKKATKYVQICPKLDIQMIWPLNKNFCEQIF